jgi:hypothetical protein
MTTTRSGRSCRRAALSFFVALAGCAGRLSPLPHPAASAQPAGGDDLDPVNQYLRARCALDGRDTFTTWSGQILAAVPGETPRRLFDVVGMNVARCGRAGDDGWFASRELMLYLDPETHAPLDRWRNPWTGEEVAVVHVANSPVQSRLSRARAPRWERVGDEARFRIDVAVAYPQPLAPGGHYQAIEMFVLDAPAAEVTERDRPTVSRLRLSWHRVGPWLPWMKMGDRPGTLVYSATGARVDGYEALPAALRAVIDERSPRFRAAPACLLDGPSETSFSYFARHRAAFERGERFPIAEERPERCTATAP